MSKAEKKDLVKAEEHKVLAAQEMPDWMKGEKATGLEELGQDDYVMPIVKLLQATDEKVQSGVAVAGDFYHMTADKNLGRNILFIPAFVRKRYMLFKPNEGQGGGGSNILARADDGIHWSPPNAEFRVKLKGKKEEISWCTRPTVAESGLAEFGSGDPDDPQSRPAATLIYDIVCLLPEYPDLSPAIIPLKGAGVKKARQWYTNMRATKAPIFGLLFSMYGVVEKNGNNTYQVHNIKGEGFLKSKELYERGAELNKLCMSQRFRADREDEPEEDMPAGKENPNY